MCPVPVEVVLFDLGGVVCDFRPERRLAALAAASGLPETDIHARIWDSGLDRSFDAGEYTAAEVHRKITEILGIPLAPDHLATMWACAFEPRPAVLTLVEAVRKRARTGLLTDNGPILLQALPSSFPNVARRFDWLLFSCEMKALKPSPELFDRVLERIAVPPERVLLIDDSARNVEGARARGLRACLYADVAKLTADLKSAGVLLA